MPSPCCVNLDPNRDLRRAAELQAIESDGLFKATESDTASLASVAEAEASSAVIAPLTAAPQATCRLRRSQIDYVESLSENSHA